MMEIGNEFNTLIDAVKGLSDKSLFDYLIAIAPIVVAIISVGIAIIALSISVKSSHQQNRIALFEKRGKILKDIEKILRLNDILIALKKPLDAEQEDIQMDEEKTRDYLALTLAVLAPESRAYDSEAKRKVLSISYKIASDLRMSEFLFEDRDKKTQKALSNMATKFIDLIGCVIIDDIDDKKSILNKRSALNEACNEFEKTHWRYLAEQIKVS